MERECQQRQQNRIERLLKASRLHLEKTWATLDLKRLPTKATQQLRGLLSGDFLDRHENVLVFGPPGSGKTHAVNAVSLELVQAGRRLLFTKCSLLVQELLKAKRDLELKAFLRKLSRWEGLVIDDLGYVQQSREEMEVLFTLLAERYERGSVLVTSNLAVLEMGADLQRPDDDGGGDRPTGASQRDRGTERAELSCGVSEANTSRIAAERRVRVGDKQQSGCGAGSAPGTVAALRFPTLRQPHTPQSLPRIQWGRIIDANGEG